MDYHLLFIRCRRMQKPIKQYAHALGFWCKSTHAAPHSSPYRLCYAKRINIDLTRKPDTKSYIVCFAARQKLCVNLLSCVR